MSVYALLTRTVRHWSEYSTLLKVKTHSLYSRPLGPGSTIVDLGANVGEFCSEVTTRFGCTCYAVEPVPENFRAIPSSDRVRKFNLAVSDRSGPLQLHLSANRECHSIDERIAAQAEESKGSVTVPGTTLEQFLADHGIDAIDVLKIDIEGAERLLFRSTSDEILGKVGQLTIEFHDFVPGSVTAAEVQQIWRRLERLGFYALPFSYMFPLSDTADILFVNTRVHRIPARDWLGFVLVRSVLALQKLKARTRTLASARRPAADGAERPV